MLKGTPPRCADNDGHNTDAIDALTLTVPVIVRYAGDPSVPRPELHRLVKQMISLTRKSPALDKYAVAWTDLLSDVLEGQDLREAVEATGKKHFGGSVKSMVERSMGQDPMTACYIDSSFPSMLHFAYKYADSSEACFLANANAGGENVARGSLLGALMGAYHGMPGLEQPPWILNGLHDKATLEEEVDQMLLAAEAKL